MDPPNKKSSRPRRFSLQALDLAGHRVRDDLAFGMANLRRLPDQTQQQLLREVRVDLAACAEIPRIHQLLNEHHYLGSLRPVGERLYYIARNAAHRWVAVLVFSAAANHLKHRDEWIGWTNEQRRRRLSLVTNNSRFLLLPDFSVPNLGSRILRLNLDRLSGDWQSRYGHPVEVVETFVDPEQFCGTVYTASGWTELGQTDGWGRCQRDYYVQHDKPKRLFVRPLRRNSCRSLQAEHLKPDLAPVEAKVSPPLYQTGEGNSVHRRLLQRAARVPGAGGVLSPLQPGCAHFPRPVVRSAARPDRPGKVRSRPQPGPATRPGDPA